jgi:hypothetical protein
VRFFSFLKDYCSLAKAYYYNEKFQSKLISYNKILNSPTVDFRFSWDSAVEIDLWNNPETVHGQTVIGSRSLVTRLGVA